MKSTKSDLSCSYKHVENWKLQTSFTSTAKITCQNNSYKQKKGHAVRYRGVQERTAELGGHRLHCEPV